MNLTTPAVAINPIPGKDPAAVAADLRAIADVVEGNPHLATVIANLFHSALWPLHAVAYGDPMREDPRAVMAATIRALKPIASGPIEKQYRDDFFDAIVPLQAVKLRLTDERSKVCTRVVTGVETVTEEVPDPEALAAVPTITRTREVETVEWQCEPLMAAAGTNADATQEG